MKFQVEARELVEVKDKIKRIVLNSSLVKKSIYFKAHDNELVLYAYSEGNYGEAHLTCQVEQEGFVELNERSLDVFDFISGLITFELIGNQLIYNAPLVQGELNVISTEPDFSEAEKPGEWLYLPKEVFDILYCNTRDDLNLENIFFDGYKIAATTRFAFAGYKHSVLLTETPFTVPITIFDILPKTDFCIAITGEKIWFQVGNFFVSSSTINYINPLVAQYGYYDFEVANEFFEITLADAKRICGYVLVISETGLASLTLKDNVLTLIPMGSELGKGSIQVECINSKGEITFGLSAKNLFNAINHVDAALCKVNYFNINDLPCLLVEGHLTRHMFTENIIAP